MATTPKKTPAKTSATGEKAAPKKREPKPVTDLASATVALNAAKRRADRAGKVLAEAETEHDAAQLALSAAKKDVQRFYAELMGEPVDEAPAGLRDEDDAYAEGEPEDPYEGAGHNA
ncbi:hypothetical protein SEA_BOGOTA_68 [Streptomyces phage Bogota]|nr:hypothetical protein SEA_BOGOTA_68 [Streptomyces phage Bogota]